MNDDEIEIAIVAILNDYGHPRSNVLSVDKSTDWLRDLDIMGDDALEIIDMIYEKFHVKMEWSDFKKRFPEEIGWDSFALTLSVWLRLGRWRRIVLDRYEPYTVGQAARAIRDGVSL